MNPFKIFAFGLAFLLLVCLVSFFFPKEGMEISFTLKFPDYESWFTEKEQPAQADISSIIASVDTTETIAEPLPEAAPDTIKTATNDTTPPIRLSSEEVRYNTNIQEFEFPEGNDTLLYKFFRKAERSYAAARPIRILHYGDSQIEGDRITSTLRNYMQKTFGGAGMGFVPLVPAVDVARTCQDNYKKWTRLTFLEKRSRNKVQDSRFGIGGGLARYTFAPEDSSRTAEFSLRRCYLGYPRAQTFSVMSLLYGRTDSSFNIALNNEIHRTCNAQSIFSVENFNFATMPERLKVSITADSIPDIYGLLLDGQNGVAVDNIPLRGASGIAPSSMNSELVRQMLNALDVEVIILQFGANVVLSETDNFNFYKNSLASHIQAWRNLKPSLSFVVISINDVGKNTPDGYISHPNVTKVRDAQKRAALENNCAFWDLYLAMGGENSMVSWVNAEPSLAQKDFLHFNPGGARIISELFCKAWENEYAKYLKNN